MNESCNFCVRYACYCTAGARAANPTAFCTGILRLVLHILFIYKVIRNVYEGNIELSGSLRHCITKDSVMYTGRLVLQR
jgi:hypothetical protein